MKKIIAISVMFALIAGAVFADTSIGGGVETRFSVIKQMQNKGVVSVDPAVKPDADATPAPVMGGSVATAQIVLSGSNADGTLGGRFRFRNTNLGLGDNNTETALYDQVYVWWKPIDQVKIFLGIEQDGLFGTGDFLEWGFHAGDNDYLFNHCWDFWRQIFPGNWDGFGLAFSFYPMPGLDINLALATGGVNWRQAPRSNVEKVQPLTNNDEAAGIDDDGNPIYKYGNGKDNTGYNGMLPGRLRLVANYSLDFGKISFVYLGGTVTAEKGPAWLGYGAGDITKDNNGTIGLSALITAIEGIQIKVGGSMVLNGNKDWNKDESMDNLINAGLGVAWNGDGFGVKFRAGLVMQGKPDEGGHQIITANILPFFAVGEKGQVLVDIGITNDGSYVWNSGKNKYTPRDANGDGEDDPALGWSVLAAYRLGIDGGAFKIGLQLYNNVNSGGNIGISGCNYVKWNVPMLLAFDF